MLTGLLFAIEEAPGGGGRLVATLPFAGTTLIEHQARQLVAAGAGQIVVVGDPSAPDLLGALHRIGRRRVAVDPVRGLIDAAARLHPLARVVMLADGLVAADATVAAMAADGGETLLVLPGAEAPPGYERIGGAEAWAGIARLDPTRIAEGAALPADYDPQSTLLRVVEGAGAVRVALPAAVAVAGHGIERDHAAIERRGRRIVAAAVATRHGWFDRLIAAPLARKAMPLAAASGLSGGLATAAAIGLGLLGAVALLAGWPRTGLLLALAATVGATIAATLATLGEERSSAMLATAAVVAMPLTAVLLLGHWATGWRGDGVPLLLAVVVAAAALLGERAMRVNRWWWGSPPAYALVVAAATLGGWPLPGLALAGCYAGATLAAAIEDRRQAVQGDA